jgi:hypothetical protein
MKKIVILLAVLMLGGCSTKFAYKNADWLVHWFIDDYVDLTRTQKDQFDADFANWLSWHKQTQLPLYLAHFEELTSDIATQNISIARMEYHQEKARDHWVRVRSHVTPDLVKLAATMSDEQVDDFFTALEKENKKDEKERLERAERSEEKRRDRWIKRNIDNLENWLGKLNDEQITLIENRYDNFTSNGMLWIDYRRRYQAAMREVFDVPDRGEAFAQAMLTLLNDPDVYRSDEMQTRSAANEEASRYYLLSLFTYSTDKQRQHLIKEINKWRDDVVDLLD